MPTAATGHDFRAYWVGEDNGFNQTPSSVDRIPFGGNATVDRFEGSNQAVRVFQPGSRAAIDIVERLFDGAFQASFIYTNPWWLYGLFGSPSTSGASAPYTHTFNGDPKSMQLVVGREQSGKERKLTGGVIAQASVAVSVNGLAQVQLTGGYAEEKVNDPASLQSQPTLDDDVMGFHEATLSLGGTTLGYVQDGTVSLPQNAEPVPEWGSRVPIDYVFRQLVPEVDFSKINESGKTTNLEKMYGGSTTIQTNVDNTEAMTFTLDNGKSGSDKNLLDINLTGTFPESYGENGLGDPNANVTEEINRMVQDADATADNSTSSPPV